MPVQKGGVPRQGAATVMPMIWAKARIVVGLAIGLGLSVVTACSGQTVSSGDGGTSSGDGGTSGSSGASGASGASGSSGDGGSSGTSGSTSGSTGTTSGTSGTVGCSSHVVTPTGGANNCKIEDTRECGKTGGANDTYDVVCRCLPSDHTCDCILNNNLEQTITTLVTCPACDPSLMAAAYKKCGYPY